MTTAPEPAAIPEWTLGWRIKRALDYAGISQLQIADEFEVNQATITRWATDKVRPRAIYLRQIALRCGVSYDWLLTGAAPDGAPGSPESQATRRYVDADRPLGTVLRLTSRPRRETAIDRAC